MINVTRYYRGPLLYYTLFNESHWRVVHAQMLLSVRDAFKKKN